MAIPPHGTYPFGKPSLTCLNFCVILTKSPINCTTCSTSEALPSADNRRSPGCSWVMLTKFPFERNKLQSVESPPDDGMYPVAIQLNSVTRLILDCGTSLSFSESLRLAVLYVSWQLKLKHPALAFVSSSSQALVTTACLEIVSAFHVKADKSN